MLVFSPGSCLGQIPTIVIDMKWGRGIFSVFICGCNIHLFVKLGNRKLYEGLVEKRYANNNDKSLLTRRLSRGRTMSQYLPVKLGSQPLERDEHRHLTLIQFVLASELKNKLSFLKKRPNQEVGREDSVDYNSHWVEIPRP